MIMALLCCAHQCCPAGLPFSTSQYAHFQVQEHACCDPEDAARSPVMCHASIAAGPGDITASKEQSSCQTVPSHMLSEHVKDICGIMQMKGAPHSCSMHVLNVFSDDHARLLQRPKPTSSCYAVPGPVMLSYFLSHSSVLHLSCGYGSTGAAAALHRLSMCPVACLQLALILSRSKFHRYKLWQPVYVRIRLPTLC